jgi:large subunit ribosomal protein L9
MQVILLERIARLGQMGQTVEVKPGFARNYLLPQKKALRATSANLSLFEAQRAKLEADNATRKAEAEKLAASMEGLKLTILRQAGEAGHLFGSVSARDIADAAKEAGHSIARSQVAMHHPIKTLGIFTEEVQLHPEVSLMVSVNIARNADEAKIQEKTGKAFLSAMAAEEDAKRSRAASKAADAAANAAEDAAAEEAQAPAAEA